MRGLLHLELADPAPLGPVPEQLPRGEASGVLVAHRNDWLVELLDAALTERGVHAVRAGRSEDEVARSLTESRPAVLLVSERLHVGSGLKLVELASSASPSTLCVVQLEADGNLPAAVGVGAAAVLSRGVSVGDVVGLVTMLARPPAGQVSATSSG